MVSNNINISMNEDNIVIDSNDEKYKTIVIFLNGILKNIKCSQINTPEEFINIDREEIIKHVNHEYLLSMETELFKKGAFKKTSVIWSRRKVAKNYILSFLRNACEQIGFTITYVYKDKYERINNKTYKRNSSYYSIIRKL